jgi:hypothetical protein
MRKEYSIKKAVFFVLPLLMFAVFAAGALQENSSLQTSTVQQDNKLQDNKDKVKKENLKLKVDKKDSVNAEPETAESGPADTVKIGAYILSVYDLDFPANKVNVDFYLWYNAKKDSLELLQYMEVINATEVNKSGETDERRGKIIYQTVRVNSQIKESWDVANFPFDEQTIEVIIEDFDKDNSKLVFIADTIGSKIDKNIHIEGWNIKDFGIKVIDNTYETNYGDPDIPLNEYSSYSRAVIYFTIEREGHGLFFKLFIGLFISVLMSLLTFFINPLDLDPRFGLSVGAIFAAIASQYVIASTLPQNATLTLVDILHDISFIYIFLCILMSTISLHYMKSGKEILSQKIDRYSFFPLAVSYIILTVFFVLRALR